MKRALIIVLLPLFGLGLKGQNDFTVTYVGELDLVLDKPDIDMRVSTHESRVRLDFEMPLMGIKQETSFVVDLETQEAIMLYSTLGMKGYQYLPPEEFPELLYTFYEFPEDQVVCTDSSLLILDYLCFYCKAWLPDSEEPQEVFYAPDLYPDLMPLGGPGSAFGGLPLKFYSPDYDVWLTAVDIKRQSLPLYLFSLEPPPGYISLE
jgi:hypothetical protein